MGKTIVAAAVVIAFNLVGPCGRKVFASPTPHGTTNTQEDTLYPAQHTRVPRRLRSDNHSTCGRWDDALDTWKPNSRSQEAFSRREKMAKDERDGTRNVCQVNNGESGTASKFHKTLPHNELGQVDETAFEALEKCITNGDFDSCEALPAGESTGFLINPIGGVSVDMMGPASSSMTAPPVPTLDSPELAAQLAECYWMALARDVPFSRYSSSDVTVAAAENLAQMPGFAAATGVAMRRDGSVDPASQLFRSSFVGVEKGPMISQLLVKEYTVDSTTITPKQVTFVPGVDYMTDYDDWLFIQNGGAPDSPEETDSTTHYIRNARDLSRLVATDIIYTEAFRGTMVLLAEGAISGAGFNGPYANSQRQKGFVSFGVSHVMKILGSAETAQRSTWYQKWNVHMFARPEALAGIVHNLLVGSLHRPKIHDSLMENDELLDRVAVANAAQNEDGTETYLLSRAVKVGSPAHPSYPAGHAVQNGAFATVLKGLFGYERGMECFRNPVYANDNGLELLPYESGDCLTYEGEINKMASNVAFGRFDSTEGMLLGEAIGVRMLQQEVATFPENHSYKFRLFEGQVIKLNHNGSFSIDGESWNGDVYTGPANC